MRSSDWIICIVSNPGGFVYSTRLERCFDRKTAHGWHYKKEAEEAAERLFPGKWVVQRRGDC